jgi:hypothetical protein
MLANTLTLDDEEEVQEELRAIQEGIADKTSIDLPSVPTTEPVLSIKEGKMKFRFFFAESSKRCTRIGASNQQSRYSNVAESYIICYICKSIYQASKFPKPILCFFLIVSPSPLSPMFIASCGRFGFKYFPTPPPPLPEFNAEFCEPTLVPNQFISSFGFSGTGAAPFSFSTFFASRSL